jgi:hypothetical protein
MCCEYAIGCATEGKVRGKGGIRIRMRMEGRKGRA